MPRRPPPPPPKGTKYPGAGRAKGTPNRVSVEARVLVSELVTNPHYQIRLRRDFEARKVHPTIESMVWAYFLGKPRQDVNVSGNLALDVNARIDEERRVFASLDIRDLEQLAAESQGLVDRAKALAEARTRAALPQPVVVEAETDPNPLVLTFSEQETLTNCAGSDNVDSVNYSTEVDNNDGSRDPSKG